MTDTETAAHLRQWVKRGNGPFAWPTDACGYEQHIKFVDYRNANWTKERSQRQSFDDFVLEYADKLDDPTSAEEVL